MDEINERKENRLSEKFFMVLPFLIFLEAQAGTEEEVWTEIASGVSQQSIRAPGTIVRITAEEIARMGAVSIEQVLQRIPGLHISTTRGFRTVYASRGIYSQNNSDFLIKINNVPVRDPILGGRPVLFTMPVKSIERIEVIRGPGSLVHGSDAIGGVINIITKTGEDLKTTPGKPGGYHFRGYAGSFDTFGGGFQYGGKSHLRNLDYMLSLEAETTDGSNREVYQDAQTAIDRIFGSTASRAPGRIRQDKQQFHLQAEVGLQDNLRLRGGFRAIENAGSGVGSFFALAPEDSLFIRMGNADLVHKSVWPGGVELSTLLSYQFRQIDLNFHPLPEGSAIFPPGMIQETRAMDHQFIWQSILDLGFVRGHRIQLGSGVTADLISDFKMRQNFIHSALGLIPLPRPTELREIPEMVDPPGNRRRRIQVFGLIQDEWNFLPDWFLTVGGRIDFYSDERIFFSPRLALVRYLSHLWSAKILYNRSFHVPSFMERAFQSSSLGGSEVIDMLELALEGQDLFGNSMGLSVFGYKLDNLIVEDIEKTSHPGIPGFSSLDLRYGVGGEVWLTRNLKDNLSVAVSYAFQRAVEDRTGQVYGMTPNHMVFAELNWAPLPDMNANVQLKWVGERKRAPEDQKKPLDGYVWLSLALQKELFPGTSITFSIQNLLDAKAKEPSNNTRALPGDIPLPGRSFIGILDVSF